MTDRRLLRRYLALVRHTAELLEECATADPAPAPAEAVALLEELTQALEPVVEQLPAQRLDPEELRRTLAGWVH